MLLQAALNPGETITELGLKQVLPERDEFQDSIFSRYVNPQDSPTGKPMVLPEEISEGATWKRSNKILPRFLKPTTQLSTTTQQRLGEELAKIAQNAPPERQVKIADAAIKLINSMNERGRQGMSGKDLVDSAKAIKVPHRKGETNPLGLLYQALENRSIYHGVETPEGPRMWQDFRTDPRTVDIRKEFLRRAAAKRNASQAIKNEESLANPGSLEDALTQSLRLLGKLPPE